MNRASILATTFALVALLAACDKSADKKPDDPAPKNAPTAAAEAKPVTIDESDLATSADFEEAAEKAIDAKNYKTELATLETEVAKD